MRHIIPHQDWPSHLARALKEATDGDTLVLPDAQCHETACAMLREEYPSKRVSLRLAEGANPCRDVPLGVHHPGDWTVRRLPPCTVTHGILESEEVDEYLHRRTLEGDPPSPDEVQAWLDHQRRLTENRQVLQEWFSCMRKEFLYPAQDAGGMQLLETMEILLQELSYQIGACITIAARSVVEKEKVDHFLAQAEKIIQDYMEEGMRQDEEDGV